MMDWADHSAAQLLEKHTYCRGERVVAFNGLALERDMAMKLRIAYAAGAAKAEIERQSNIRKIES